MMNVVILTEGGQKIGFGHICRCLALYEAFKKASYLPFLVINGDNTVKTFLQNYQFQILNWLEERNFLYNLLKKAEVVVLDTYLASLSIYEDIAKLPVKLLCLDDFNRLPYPRGFVLNPSPEAEKLGYPQNPDVEYLFGPKYALLRPEFWNVPKRKIKTKVDTLLLTIGGTDITNLIPSILQFLTDKYPKLKKKVVIGKGFKNVKKIEEIKDSYTELVYFPNAQKMKELMISSDIAISAGGQTLYELSCTGTPTVAIIIAENQIYNVNGLAELGIVENAGWYNSSNFWKKLKIILTSLIDNKTKREKMAQKGQTLVNGQGAKRVAEILISAIKKDLS